MRGSVPYSRIKPVLLHVNVCTVQIPSRSTQDQEGQLAPAHKRVTSGTKDITSTCLLVVRASYPNLSLNTHAHRDWRIDRLGWLLKDVRRKATVLDNVIRPLGRALGHSLGCILDNESGSRTAEAG